MLKLQYNTLSHSLDEKKLFLPFISMNIKLFLMKIKIYLSVRTLFIEFFQFFLFVFIKNCLKFIN